MLIRVSETLYVDLVHLQHDIHDPREFLIILILQHLAQDRGDDLPGHPELVFELAAESFFSAFGELAPYLLDFERHSHDRARRRTGATDTALPSDSLPQYVVGRQSVESVVSFDGSSEAP